MSRIKRGWELTKKSWAVLRENRSLLRFPLYGGVALIIFGVLTLGPGLYLIEEGEIAPGAPLVVIGLYLLAFIGFYFSVGLAYCADRIFQGEQPTVSEGLAVSRSRLPQIAGWAALATTVGLLLQLLAEEGGVLGSIVGRLLNVGWSLITFLAVPVIAFEGTSAFSTLKRSSTLFRERWGQQITGNIAIGGAVALFGILPSALLVGAGIALWATSGFAGAILVIVGLIGLAISALISQALSGIFGVALYRYATEGQPVGGFTSDDMESAVRRKKGAGPAPATV
jgi:hypothetical protein